MQDITDELLGKIEGQQTPTTDRGVTVTFQGIHWLTGVSLLPPKEVRDIVSQHLYGLVLDDSPSGIWTYQYKAVERASKAFVAWSDHQPGRPDDARPDVCVNLPGEACELLGTVGLVALVAALGLRVTRLDLAWDTDIFTPRLVLDSWDAGNAVSHVKKRKWINEDHDTLYIGSRSAQNARMVRIYNRRGPTRLEIELHKIRADNVWTLLQAMPLEEWSTAGLHCLVDFVDFRDRAADVNVGRCPRLDWFEAFTAGASRLHMPIPRKVLDLEAQGKWLDRGVSAALATYAQSRPDATQYLLDLFSAGRANMKPRHHALLAAVRLEVDNAAD